MYRTSKNGMVYEFQDDHLKVGNTRLSYVDMTDIAHRGGDDPAFVFTYNNKRYSLPYNAEEYTAILPYFQMAVSAVPAPEGTAAQTQQPAQSQPAQPQQPIQSQQPAQPYDDGVVRTQNYADPNAGYAYEPAQQDYADPNAGYAYEPAQQDYADPNAGYTYEPAQAAPEVQPQPAVQQQPPIQPAPPVQMVQIAEKQKGFWSVGRLVIGILAMALSMFILFQSCAAGVVNTLEESDEASGSMGFFLAVFMITGGIVGIVTRNSRKKAGPIITAILFVIAALCGFAGIGSSFGDLVVWGVVAACFGAVFLICGIKTKAR